MKIENRSWRQKLRFVNNAARRAKAETESRLPVNFAKTETEIRIKTFPLLPNSAQSFNQVEDGDEKRECERNDDFIDDDALGEISSSNGTGGVQQEEQ